MRLAHILVSVSCGLAFGAGLAGCGSSDSKGSDSTNVDIATLVPGNNKISGWTVNPNGRFTQGQVLIFHSGSEATEKEDGSAEPFYKEGHQAVVMALQNYIDSSSNNVGLRIAQMSSAADCQWLYTDILTNSAYGGQWEDTDVGGDKGRINDTNYVNACKGPYFVAVLPDDSSSASKDPALNFARAVIQGIP
jgi:hypothetical protein